MAWSKDASAPHRLLLPPISVIYQIGRSRILPALHQPIGISNRTYRQHLPHRPQPGETDEGREEPCDEYWVLPQRRNNPGKNGFLSQAGMSSTLVPPNARELLLESRHWDRQDPITTGTMFGGTILHTHAQRKPFEAIQYMNKTCICDREGFSAQSTFHL